MMDTKEEEKEKNRTIETITVIGPPAAQKSSLSPPDDLQGAELSERLFKIYYTQTFNFSEAETLVCLFLAVTAPLKHGVGTEIQFIGDCEAISPSSLRIYIYLGM